MQGTQNPDESQWTIDGQELSNVRAPTRQAIQPANHRSREHLTSKASCHKASRHVGLTKILSTKPGCRTWGQEFNDGDIFKLRYQKLSASCHLHLDAYAVLSIPVHGLQSIVLLERAMVLACRSHWSAS